MAWKFVSVPFCPSSGQSIVAPTVNFPEVSQQISSLFLLSYLLHSTQYPSGLLGFFFYSSYFSLFPFLLCSPKRAHKYSNLLSLLPLSPNQHLRKHLSFSLSCSFLSSYSGVTVRKRKVSLKIQIQQLDSLSWKEACPWGSDYTYKDNNKTGGCKAV